MTTAKPTNRRLAPLALLGVLLVVTAIPVATAEGEIPALEIPGPDSTASCSGPRDCAWENFNHELAWLVGQCIAVDCWQLD